MNQKCTSRIPKPTAKMAVSSPMVRVSDIEDRLDMSEFEPGEMITQREVERCRTRNEVTNILYLEMMIRMSTKRYRLRLLPFEAL